MASVGLAIIRNDSSVGWKKWQIAVAIGTPIVIIGVGWYIYRKRVNKEVKKHKLSNDKNEKLPRPVNNVSPSSVGTLEDKAEEAKITGNRLFKEGNYEEAVKSYTEAIALCPSHRKEGLATFYQNRAASFEKLKCYDKVIEDCNKALEFNPLYVKALTRRSKAFEHQGKFQSALEDATAICVLEEFQNQSSLVLADRILKRLGLELAQEAMKTCEPLMPTNHFIKSYFSSFSRDPVVTYTPDPEASTESGFLKAREDFLKGSYDNIVEDCNCDAEDDSKSWKTLAKLLRATFYLLRGQPILAGTEFESILELGDALDGNIKSNVLIKMASLDVQYNRLDQAFERYVMAEECDPTNPDTYHHRGQVDLLLERAEDACRDFDKAHELNPNYSLSAVQKRYADYRMAHSKDSSQVDKAMAEFKSILQKFPKSAEGHALYAQSLSEQKNHAKASKYYDKAISLEPHNANFYVHKGLLYVTWKQNFEEAISIVEKGIEVDDTCEFAYETLGAIEVQRGNLDRAMELFDRALKTARTEPELAHLYSLHHAAAAQKLVTNRLGIALPTRD